MKRNRSAFEGGNMLEVDYEDKPPVVPLDDDLPPAEPPDDWLPDEEPDEPIASITEEG
jgi:hypothetical protein